MALVPCARCGQPFYASCHDASCIDALCPLCEYGEEEATVTKTALERRALYQTRELGHTIPSIAWDADGDEGSGTCTRCGDGVLLYARPDSTVINGTAYESVCPGDTCAHGWQIIQRPWHAVTLRCLHCGAERSEQ